MIDEVARAGSYTYLHLAPPEDRWLVVMGAGAAPGAAVTWHAYARVAPFTSPRLNRAFDAVWFATVEP